MAEDVNSRKDRLPAWLSEHIDLYRRDPKAAHDWDPSTLTGTVSVGPHPTLLLTTSGRRSGQPRSIPLLYQPCGEGFVVVASKGGAERHPLWYENLLAEPKCQVVAGCLRCEATARTSSGEERVRLWQAMLRLWPSYEDYQAATEREIPVVVLRVRNVALGSDSGAS